MEGVSDQWTVSMLRSMWRGRGGTQTDTERRGERSGLEESRVQWVGRVLRAAVGCESAEMGNKALSGGSEVCMDQWGAEEQRALGWMGNGTEKGKRPESSADAEIHLGVSGMGKGEDATTNGRSTMRVNIHTHESPSPTRPKPPQLPVKYSWSDTVTNPC